MSLYKDRARSYTGPMGIGYTVDTGRGFVFIRGWDVLTEAQVRAMSETLLDEAHFDPLFDVLVDLTDVQTVSISPSYPQSYRSPFHSRSRRAVFTRSDYVFGLTRMYESAVAESDEFFVGREAAEALAWLGLPADTELPEVVRVFGE